ncbi:MAG: sodium-dependent transporter [Fusobacteriota bacterium]
MESLKRDSFGSKLGALAALSGSAIGLGNIWRFPYMVGENGGSAFIIIYLVCIILLGFPIMLSEFIIGRKTSKNTVGAFKKLSNNKFWKTPGYLGIVSSFLILSFYGVVGGWALNFTFRGLTNNFLNKSSDELEILFGNFISSPFGPIFWQILFMLLTMGIVLAGIKNGIEKYSKFLMPLLLIIILALNIRALTLPGAKEGLSFLFKPDFSKLTHKSILSALGHAFFTLSLGMGTMITYGSYISKKEDLGQTVAQVAIADTVIALLAGIAIFPAVFAFNISPQAGPGLVFITLPSIFQRMIGGQIYLTIFFLLLTISALTSAISILEVGVAYFAEEFNFGRKKATIIITSIITFFGMLCSLSQGVLSEFLIFGKSIFDLFDFVTAAILLPLGSILILIFVGHVMKKKEVFNEIDTGKNTKVQYNKLFWFLAKYIAPVAIILVMLNGLGIL